MVSTRDFLRLSKGDDVLPSGLPLLFFSTLVLVLHDFETHVEASLFNAPWLRAETY